MKKIKQLERGVKSCFARTMSSLCCFYFTKLFMTIYSRRMEARKASMPTMAAPTTQVSLSTTIWC